MVGDLERLVELFRYSNHFIKCLPRILGLCQEELLNLFIPFQLEAPRGSRDCEPFQIDAL